MIGCTLFTFSFLLEYIKGLNMGLDVRKPVFGDLRTSAQTDQRFGNRSLECIISKLATSDISVKICSWADRFGYDLVANH